MHLKRSVASLTRIVLAANLSRFVSTARREMHAAGRLGLIGRPVSGLAKRLHDVDFVAACCRGLKGDILHRIDVAAKV